jgi:hypothetical protein
MPIFIISTDSGGGIFKVFAHFLLRVAVYPHFGHKSECSTMPKRMQKDAEMENQRGRLQLEPPSCDDRRIRDIEAATFHLPVLTVADELGLFALLAKQPATASEIAGALSLGARATEALLGLLTALGLLIQYDGKFTNTEVTDNYLLPESPYYLGAWLRAVRERPPTYVSVHEAILKDDLRSHTGEWLAGGLDPEQAKQFTGRMHSRGLPLAMGVARRGNFDGVSRLLDVAGGSGCFCIALAMRYPDMRFTVLELPSVCPLTQQYIDDYGLSDQIDTYAADMFNDPLPTGYDAIFLSDIFHDWERERNLQLARRSYEALPAGGRIYLHETLLQDSKDGPLAAITHSLRMLMNTQGKQFTATELSDLLSESGFEAVQVTPTSAYASLISARKP